MIKIEPSNWFLTLTIILLLSRRSEGLSNHDGVDSLDNTSLPANPSPAPPLWRKFGAGGAGSLHGKEGEHRPGRGGGGRFLSGKTGKCMAPFMNERKSFVWNQKVDFPLTYSWSADVEVSSEASGPAQWLHRVYIGRMWIQIPKASGSQRKDINVALWFKQSNCDGMSETIKPRTLDQSDHNFFAGLVKHLPLSLPVAEDGSVAASDIQDFDVHGNVRKRSIRQEEHAEDGSILFSLRHEIVNGKIEIDNAGRSIQGRHENGTLSLRWSADKGITQIASQTHVRFEPKNEDVREVLGGAPKGTQGHLDDQMSIKKVTFMFNSKCDFWANIFVCP